MWETAASKLHARARGGQDDEITRDETEIRTARCTAPASWCTSARCIAPQGSIPTAKRIVAAATSATTGSGVPSPLMSAIASEIGYLPVG
jgi:hypothetical protein